MPLIRASSDLSDGLEPHDHITTAVPHPAPVQHAAVVGGVYPGWCSMGGCGRVHTGYPAEAVFEAYLMNSEE